MRLFIGVMVPERLGNELEQAQKQLEKLHLDAKFVKKDNFHYNFKFLGEVEEVKLLKIKASVDKIASQYEPFDIHVSGIGSFPSKNYVRVIWAGATEGSKQLGSIANQVDKNLSKFGFPEETRAFTAHLTLCRLHSGFNDPKLLKTLRNIEQNDFGAFNAKKIELIRSVLSSAGPVYKTIHEAAFK